MSSALTFVTNSLGSNDKTIILFDGEEIYNGDSKLSASDVFDLMQDFGGHAEHYEFHKLNNKDFDNWENVIYA